MSKPRRPSPTLTDELYQFHVRKGFWVKLHRAWGVIAPLSFLLVGLVGAPAWSASSDDKEKLTDTIMAKLKPFDLMIGQFEGNGSGTGLNKKKAWDENIVSNWKFSKSGRVSFHWKVTTPKDRPDGRWIDEAIISYDPEKDQYKFYAFKAGTQDVLKFMGEAKTNSNLVFERIEKGDADDDLDRIDLKLLADGNRIVYRFDRRIGKSSRFKQLAQIALDRKGTSIAGSGGNKGPECIVTGGKATIAVSYKGKTYMVCCSGCKETFLEDPERWLAKLNKKK